MPHIDPTWQAAAGAAVLLVLAGVVLLWRGWSRTGAALREAGLVATLYAAWQLIGTVTQRNVDGARTNALAVWHAEQALHLPSELAMQQAITPHPWLVQLANAYYVYGHFNPIVLLLAWVFLQHRAAYPRVRLLLCLVTAAAFVVHFIAVAPPRLMPELGFRDVALEYGQSVYGSFGAGIPGQLLAMPSLHVGWAILLAYVVVTHASSRWRWLVVAHPVLMTVDVVVTANHWWADGIVAGALVAVCVALERALRLVPWRSVAPVPAALATSPLR